MWLLRLVWSRHWITQLRGIGGTLSCQWCWAGCWLPAGTAFSLLSHYEYNPLARQQGAMCWSGVMQRVPFLAGSSICFIKRKQASVCQHTRHWNKLHMQRGCALVILMCPKLNSFATGQKSDCLKFHVGTQLCFWSKVFGLSFSGFARKCWCYTS